MCFFTGHFLFIELWKVDWHWCLTTASITVVTFLVSVGAV